MSRRAGIQPRLFCWRIWPPKVKLYSIGVNCRKKMKIMRYYLLTVFLGFQCVYVNGMTGKVAYSKRDSIARQQIAQFFTPPDSSKEQFGDFRSPLQFYNGTWVQRKEDWQRRRMEILERWHSLMGKWPPLLKQQTFVIDSSVHKEGYVQHHVRFKWLPDEWTDGYLLVPTIDRGSKH